MDMPARGAHLGAGIIMAPSLDFMDRAYLSARTEGISHIPDRRDADSEHHR